MPKSEYASRPRYSEYAKGEMMRRDVQRALRSSVLLQSRPTALHPRLHPRALHCGVLVVSVSSVSACMVLAVCVPVVCVCVCVCVCV